MMSCRNLNTSSLLDKILLFSLAFLFFLTYSIRIGLITFSGETWEIILWHASFAQSMANHPAFSIYAHNIGYPTPAAAVFGLPIDYAASLLIRAGLSPILGIICIFLLCLFFAGWGAYLLARFFHVRPLYALLGCFVWMSCPTHLRNIQYGGLGLNMLFLPLYFYITLLFMTRSGENFKNKIKYAILYCSAVIFSLYMDGYTFVMFAVLGSSLAFYLLIFRKNLRRFLITWVLPIHFGSFLIAYLLYVAYVGQSHWMNFNPANFIYGGGELLYYIFPYQGTVPLFDLLGICRNTQNLYAGRECLRITIFAGQMILPACVALYFVLKKRKMALFLLLLSICSYYISFGINFQFEIQDFTSVETVQKSGIGPTGNEILYRMPGFKDMRCIYRFSSLGLMGLWCLLLLLCNRNNRKEEILSVTFLFLILIVNLTPFVPFSNVQQKHFSELEEQMIVPGKDLLAPLERVFILPVQNDFIIPYFASVLNLQSYNIGGDKNLFTAQKKWPSHLNALARNPYSVSNIPYSASEILQALISTPVDAIIFYYNSFIPNHPIYSWTIWPPRNAGKHLFESAEKDLEKTGFVSVQRTPLFSVIRLKKGSLEPQNIKEIKKSLNLYTPKAVDFSKTNTGIEIKGLYDSENWGRWSNGELVEMLLDLSPDLTKDNLLLTFECMAAMIHRESQKVKISANGKHIAEWIFTTTNPKGKFECILSQEVLQKLPLRLSFQIENPISPAKAGLNNDTRDLAIGFQTLSIKTLDAPPKIISFTKDHPGVIAYHFAPPSEHGRWTLEKENQLFLALPRHLHRKNIVLEFDCYAFLPDSKFTQTVTLGLDNENVDTWIFSINENRKKRTLRISSEWTKKGVLPIHINVKNPQSPAKLGLASDIRTLGINFISLIIKETDQ